MTNLHPVTNYPLLEGSNYHTWAAAMERLLKTEGLLAPEGHFTKLDHLVIRHFVIIRLLLVEL